MNITKRIQSHLLSSTPRAEVQQNMSDILKAQIEFLEEFKNFIPFYLSLRSNREILGLLIKLDDDFIAWENAVQKHVGKISDFLDAADSTVGSMGENLEALLEKYNEHINQGILPALELSEVLKALMKKIVAMDVIIKKLPIPYETLPPEMKNYYQSWSMYNLKQTNSIAILQKHIALFNKFSSKENLEATIEKYTSITQRLTKTYNELIDMEQGVEVQLEEHAEDIQINASREEKRAQFAAMSSLDNLLQRPFNDDPLNKLVEEVEKNSPPVSPILTGSVSHTPPSDSSVLERSSYDEDLLTESSISLSRKSDSSGDESKQEKSKVASSIPSSKLTSNALMSLKLPPASLVSPPLNHKESKQSSPANVSNTTAVSAAPKKDKGLIAKLGFNRDKSAPQQLHSTTTSVTPLVTEQRKGFSSAH